ncbi:hypothetical protein [Streptomyces xiaopingdaonensis]|uniref:hypothetical protein n=1 Tax=Streptomyces xiaopingdaonensis TaxID=1565415 RepID=UPI0002E142DE|nr:hypothetical protein [Streptomyces xiaopingdaonensis]
MDGVEADLASSCRSQYRSRREADGVRHIVALTSTCKKHTPSPVLPGTTVHPDTTEPPAHRFLSWFTNRLDYPLDSDDLGDDQPDDGAEQSRSEPTWLHQTPTAPAA